MPRIIGNTLKDHRKKTRQQLFDALSRLMATNSFESLTMAKIASEAQVGRTAVYNHFQDKEALLLAYITYETGQYSLRLKKVLEGVNDPIKQLRIYMREQLLLGTSYHLAPGTNLLRQVSPENNQELHAHAGIVENILRQILRQAMKAGIIPMQNLTIAISLVNSCLAGRRLPSDPARREFLIHSIQTYILRALGVDHALAPLPNARRFFDRQLDVEENPFKNQMDPGLSVLACPIHQVG